MGVQNLYNTATRWVCAKMAYTQGVDIMLIVSKHAEGMSLRYNRTYFRRNKSFLSSI